MIKKEKETFGYQKTEPLVRESDSEDEREDIRRSGETGVRPNVSASISGTSGTTTKYSKSESSKDYGPMNLVKRTRQTEVGGVVKQISVTVGVPRSYFALLYQQENPDDTQKPDQTKLKPIIDVELAKIKQTVRTLIDLPIKGVVSARMIPDAGALLALTGYGRINDSPMIALLKGDYVKPITVGLMALVALGLMFTMVRKATRQPQLPTVEELAGVPPSLPSEEDVIGEAGASDTGLTGVEVAEEELNSRRIADQISDMIKESPDEATSLFNRWIKPNEY